MTIQALMRQFTIRFRMLSAIAVVMGLLGMLGGAGMARLGEAATLQRRQHAMYKGGRSY